MGFYGIDWVFMVLFLGSAYFLPWFIAMGRDHHQRSAIAVLNLLAGWTLIGWVVALVWSCTAVHAPMKATEVQAP
jgi:hypothetical protein